MVLSTLTDVAPGGGTDDDGSIPVLNAIDRRDQRRGDHGGPAKARMTVRTVPLQCAACRQRGRLRRQ
jgi:hypothetical protein